LREFRFEMAEDGGFAIKTGNFVGFTTIDCVLLSVAILDGGLSYEMADDGGFAIWTAKSQMNHVKATSPKPTSAPACKFPKLRGRSRRSGGSAVWCVDQVEARWSW
jgi:hypothetical protein